MKFLRALLFFLVGLAHVLSRADKAEPPAFRPESQWIGLDTPSKPNEWIAFRRDFDLRSGVSGLRARIAGDSKYWLWVNGRLVVFEGGLKRGPAPGATYFDVIDIAPYLRRGRNSVALLLWYFGKPGFSHVSSGRAGLLFELYRPGGEIVLASGKEWRALPHPAFSDTDKPLPNFRLPESNIRFDARADLPTDWRTAPADPARWPAASVLGAAGAEPWGSLTMRPIPQWRDSGPRDYVNQAEFPATSDHLPNRLLVAKLPYNAQVTPILEIEAPAGLKIGIQTDNYRGGGDPNVRAEYITREGRQSFESLGWMNGHAVHYSIPPGVRIRALKYRETGYDASFSGSFACDDPFLEKLHAKAARTLYVTMRDNYMDCPDRERAQWWGDAVIEIGEAFYALDRRSDALARKAILQLAAFQRSDGCLYAPIPASNWDKELPLQMLASVGEKGFWTYELHSGDLDTLRAVYPAVRRYLQLWKVSPEGRVAQRQGGWAWGDWGKDIDMPLLTEAWYYLALQGFRHMAENLGHPEDLPWIDDQMKRIAAGFDAAYWHDRAYRSASYQGRTDDRANGLAVVAGLVPRERFPALRELFRAEFNASPYMEKYVLEALFLMGDADGALARLHQRYAEMVNDPACTTLWEGWKLNTAEFGGGTYNHAWSGGPLTLMYQYLAGIAPLAPGYTRFQVLPSPGPLRRLRAVVTSARGEITMALQRPPDDSKLTLEVSVPRGATCLAGLPLLVGRPFREIKLNGSPIWRDGQFVSGTPTGVSLESNSSPAHLVFDLPPGTWRLLGTR
jgi:hypothetical protein